MAHGDYYNPTNKSVVDGAIVYAEDVNKINTAVDAALDQVASDLDDLEASIGDGGVASKDWATEDQGIRPDPVLDLYSSRAYAMEAKDWAIATGAIVEASTGLPLAGNYSAKTYSGLAQGHATNAQTYSNNAASSASLAGTRATNAQTYATNSLNSASAASGFASAASGFASAASGSAISASGFADDASGFADDASDFADAAAASAADAANSRSRKNAIINGNFDIWQRATSQTTSGYGSDDRWYNAHSGTGKTTSTTSRQPFIVGQTDVPGGPKYYSRTVVTSVVSTTSSATKCQKVESVYTFSGETVTLSFYAKADSSKSIAIEFIQDFGTGGGASAAVLSIGSQKFSLTSSWQKFTATVNIPSISGKTVGTSLNDNLTVAFWFDAGSSFNSRTGTLGQQSGTFDIAQVQLELGSTATDFERRTFGEELHLCYRYLEPITGTAIIGEMYKHQRFTVTKRDTPAITIIYGGFGGGNYDINSYTFRVGSTVAPTSNQDFTVLVDAEI